MCLTFTDSKLMLHLLSSSELVIPVCSEYQCFEKCLFQLAFGLWLYLVFVG